MNGDGRKQQAADGLQERGPSVGALSGTRVRVVCIRNDLDVWRFS